MQPTRRKYCHLSCKHSFANAFSGHNYDAFLFLDETRYHPFVFVRFGFFEELLPLNESTLVSGVENTTRVKRCSRARELLFKLERIVPKDLNDFL